MVKHSWVGTVVSNNGGFMNAREQAITDYPYLYLSIATLSARDDKEQLNLMDKWASAYIGWGKMWEKNRKIALGHKAKAEKLDRILRENYPTKNQLDFKNFEEIV